MIRLSHSALDTLHVCERKFQLDRLLVGDSTKQDFPATVLGKAYGAAVQSYMVHQDVDLAIWECYKAYYPILEDEGKRTEEIAIALFLASVEKLDNLLLDWEVSTFNNKPAIELSFRLNIDETFYFVGYVDLVIKNKYTSSHAIMEVKTTALNLFDLSSLYQNSGQALGYSIVLDKIVGESLSNYEVLYHVAQLGAGNGFSPKIHTLQYPKNLNDRLNWFITLGMDVEHLKLMIESNVFPLRGSNCLQYMRPCKHFGTCNLHSLDQYKKQEEDLIEYQFIYSLDEVIADHLRRM